MLLNFIISMNEVFESHANKGAGGQILNWM